MHHHRSANVRNCAGVLTWAGSVLRSLEPCPADHAAMEYTKQLLLGCLLNVLHKLFPEGRGVAAGGFKMANLPRSRVE